MKRITNILSYLCLLLLLLVVACSDLEEITIAIQGEEEVELTIKTNVPSLGGSTRSVVDAENITSITALAFDSDHELIKVTTAELNITNIENDNSTTGTMTIKVPVRTRRIHFIAKNGGEFTDITNENNKDYGKSDVDLLKGLVTTQLHYWQMVDFNSSEELKSFNGDITLIRNMARVELVAGTNDYIAGFLNYNTEGTVAPYNDAGDNPDFGYTGSKNSVYYLPATHTTSDESDLYSGTKPKAQYVFAETNSNGDYMYTICNIGYKYYKIAFATAGTDGNPIYFPLVRNHKYIITIAEGINTTFGRDSFAAAVEAPPINATAQEEVDFIFDYDTFFMFIEDKTCEIPVTIPAGITQLKVLTVEQFTIDSIVPELDAEGGLYTVTPGETYTFTFMLDEKHTETGIAMVRFIGNGETKIAHKDVEVKIKNKTTLTINPKEQTINNTEDSNCYVDVTIPANANINNLVIEAGEAFTVTSVATLSSTPVSPNDDGSYTVTNTTYRVTLTLKDDAVGQIGEYPIHFAGTSEYWGAEGTATITLQEYVAEDLDVYEMWFENNNAWNGSQDYNIFFSQSGEITTGNGNAENMRETFYDAFTVNSTTYSADNHKSQHLVMGSDDSFTFTIPAGDSRYLTMLVAADGSNTPSIKLMQGETEWTTSAEANATKVDGTYNFGNGEIGTAGRLIRYKLEPGTYTLKGSDDAAYLLYYMRVTKDKPTMTDVATDATASNYTLAWSGGDWGNYTKINDTYFVDDDAKTFTPTLTYKGLNGVKLAASSSLNITTGKYSFSDNQGDGTTITYEEAKSNSNGSNNGDIAITGDYNAGTYALNGIANVTDTEYKYAAFYDVLRLNTVGFTVKNTIKLGLYYSWNGDANTITEYVDGLPYIIGFRMPYSLPVAINAENDTSTPINFTIDSKWERRESGLGVICNAPNYQLASQQEGNSSNNRVHPRPEWTYKIEWYEVAANTIQPTTADTDIYFSYGKDNSGNAYITKEPEIATIKSTTEKLALTLDFSSNSENGSTHTLNFGDNFYLRARISDGDSRKYAGAHVRFNGSFSNNTQGDGNSAINWTDSRKDGSIEYARNSSDGTQLQFKVEAGKTEYEIYWQFVRNDSNTTPTQFTYTVDNDAYNITNGSESATIVLNGNGQVVDNPLNLNLDFYALDANSQKVEKGVNGSYADLLLGTSRFVLEVSIDDADLQDYSGQTVYLAGDFETTVPGAAENGWAIRWDQSKTNGAINYYGQNNNGSGLQFQINGNKTYLIEWVFKTGGNYNGGEIGFDYKISAHSDSPTKYNLSGDTQATIAFTNESQILVATNGNQASNSINLSLEYGENSAEEFTVDVPVPNNVSGINISVPNYLAVSIGKLKADNEQYPGAAVAVNGNYTFTDSDKTTAPRFKFKLNGSPTENSSVITFTSADGNASKATVTVNWTQRGAESNQTTIWSGAMDLQWTQNYLEATTNQLPADTQVMLNFTTINGQNGQIKLHDSGGNQIASENIQGITYDSNNGVSVGNNADQLTFTLQNAVNGLKINGNNVRMTSIVVSTSTASTEPVIDDEDFSNFKHVGQEQKQGSVSVENGILCLTNETDRQNAWDEQAMYETNGIEYGTTYTLTFKAMIENNTQGEMAVAIQRFENGNCVATDHYRIFTINDINNAKKENQDWAEFTYDITIQDNNQETPNKNNPTHFMFNFGDLVGTLYIDDLRLVKKN